MAFLQAFSPNRKSIAWMLTHPRSPSCTWGEFRSYNNCATMRCIHRWKFNADEFLVPYSLAVTMIVANAHATFERNMYTMPRKERKRTAKKRTHTIRNRSWLLGTSNSDVAPKIPSAMGDYDNDGRRFYVSSIFTLLLFLLLLWMLVVWCSGVAVANWLIKYDSLPFASAAVFDLIYSRRERKRKKKQTKTITYMYESQW